MILKSEVYKATKNYNCDACNYILSFYGKSGFYDLPLTKDELEIIKRAEANNWKILKGEKYLYQVSVFDGFQTTKSIIGIVEICSKYKLFDY